MSNILPYIPAFITVHLGVPSNAGARNETVTFPDYIKNVASSEIYPTWHENALRANIYAQISFALNRVYTEYYRSQGYDFDITNSTAIDQSYISGRDLFENIVQIVDEIFNDYVRRIGNIEPLFTQYCNGTTSVCPGLSQWGTVELANQGMTAFEILQYYYGDDIEIVNDAPIQGIVRTYPNTPLRLGTISEDVKCIQRRLNRISTNFPAINKILPVDGFFSQTTDTAIRAFQSIFNLYVDGVVGKATWYQVQYIYYAVKKINDLNSEGITLEDIPQQFHSPLSEGDIGNDVRVLQYYLAYIAQYDLSVNPIEIDGIFGPQTRNAVIAFQKAYDLEVTGIVNAVTYNRVIDVYRGIIFSLPDNMFENSARPFPGVQLFLGMENEYILYMQTYLNYIALTYRQIPQVIESGIFDNITEHTVTIFQEMTGLPITGTVGVLTWTKIADIYDDLRAGEFLNIGQFPGYDLS